MSSQLMILVAGPYRSGTNDEPELLDANLAYLESMAWPRKRLQSKVGTMTLTGTRVLEFMTHSKPLTARRVRRRALGLPGKE